MRFEPDDKERAELERIAHTIIERIEAIGAEAILGGSFAKDTWLPGTRDIDVFARFDVGSEPELETSIRRMHEAFPEGEVVHGSRDYLRFDVHGVTVEIIPIRPLSPTANTMDHSPDHVSYVREHLDNPNDVRALKAILKAQRAYGAESHVRGFSGYVCELLIIKYRTLSALAGIASLWTPGTRVSFHEESPAFDEPLIVEDPTDAQRNAAAAVSEAQLERFVSIMTRISTGEAIDTLLEGFAIEAPYARIVMRSEHEKPDIAAAQLRKIHDRLERELEPFGVLEAEWEWDEHRWTSRFSLERYELEATETRIGPPSTMERAVEAFRAQHPDAYEDHGRMAAVVERSETRWEHVAKRVCEAPEVASCETEEIR